MVDAPLDDWTVRMQKKNLKTKINSENIFWSQESKNAKNYTVKYLKLNNANSNFSDQLKPKPSWTKTYSL